jgi:16S rRNA (adenine1518-N6/adenine1519-N6)-dimethyltransferase
MKISNPSELQKFLSEHDLHAKKSSSQNFLIDGNIVRKIVKEAAVTSDDVVIEIGPGPGALTEGLLETGCLLIAIEKDSTLAPLLNRLQTHPPRLEVYNDDILEFPLEEVLRTKLKKGKKAKVVANLPYHITTPILAKLVKMTSLLSDIIVMVQKELAERLVAVKGTKNYSSFTIFLEYYSRIHYAFTVDANCFYPKPSVQSSIVHLSTISPPDIPEPDAFFILLRKAFQQRRKMLRSSLKSLYSSDKIEESLTQLSLNVQVRPEQLSLEEFIQLYLLLRA